MRDSESQPENETEPNLTAEIMEYAEKKAELMIINYAEKISLAFARFFQRIIGLLLLGSALFFGWFAVGFLLSDLIGNHAVGFALAALPLLIISFIFVNRKSAKLTEKIQAEMMQSILSGKEEENSDESGKEG